MQNIEMKKRAVLLGLAFILFGCAGMEAQLQLPDIEPQAPVGYPRLIKMVPECTNVNPHNYSSCLVAARMIESSTTQISTYRFLDYWEKTAFSDASNPAAIEAAQRIVIPVLKRLYQTSPDEYSKTMLHQADKIQLASKGSFDTFQKIHKCLITHGKPADCRKL
jgi:hypothetical protein